ncbi:uncharacterized protein LOC125958282 [Anopheles darlingi]|uniref:uncharacterized protein LOC125958282 n=1 Tax=Anopheles darlingi TaxID=43151 RepID=UPI0021001EAC|nr:uncharacterized protein LOC125958282 [Anopheles darlingi]
MNIIFESVQLAKLGMLSKALLFPSEMDFIINILVKEGIQISSYDQAYQYLEPRAIHKGQEIQLLVKIPKLRNGNYSLLRIEPIPKNQAVIQTLSKYVVINKQESYLVGKFNRIEKEYILKLTDLQNITGNQCEHQLLRANPSRCVTTHHDNNMEVANIENYGILIKNAETAILENTCEFGNRNLSGTFLVGFRNCTVSVNGIKYENKQMQSEEQPNIIPLNSIQIETKKIHLDAFQNTTYLHISNRDKIRELTKTNRTIIAHQATSFTIISMAIIITAWCLIVKINNLRRKVTITVKPELDRDAPI